MTASILIYSLQFLYICLKIIVQKEFIDQIGGVLFISYAFFNFFVIVGYFVQFLIYGAEANQIDQKIKELMVKLSKDCIEAKTLCDNGRIFRRKIGNMNKKLTKD